MPTLLNGIFRLAACPLRADTGLSMRAQRACGWVAYSLLVSPCRKRCMDDVKSRLVLMENGRSGGDEAEARLQRV